MLNPFSRLKNIKRPEGTKGNLVGEGLVLAACTLVPPGASSAHAEAGRDHPMTEELLAPCRNSRPGTAANRSRPMPSAEGGSSNVINVNVTARASDVVRVYDGAGRL